MNKSRYVAVFLSLSLILAPLALAQAYRDWQGRPQIGEYDRIAAIEAQLEGAPIVFDGRGTISITSGAAAVVGVDTAFTSQLQVGDYIVAGNKTMLVSAIASDSAATVSANVTGGIGEDVVVAPPPTVLSSFVASPAGGGTRSFYVPRFGTDVRLVVAALQTVDAVTSVPSVDGVAMTSLGAAADITVPTNTRYGSLWASGLLEPGWHSIKSPSTFNVTSALGVVVAGVPALPVQFLHNNIAVADFAVTPTTVGAPELDIAEMFAVGFWRGVIQYGLGGTEVASNMLASDNTLLAVAGTSAGDLAVAYDTAARSVFGVAWDLEGAAFVAAAQAGTYKVVRLPSKAPAGRFVYGSRTMVAAVVDDTGEFMFPDKSQNSVAAAGLARYGFAVPVSTLVTAGDAELSLDSNLMTEGTEVVATAAATTAATAWALQAEVDGAEMTCESLTITGP